MKRDTGTKLQNIFSLTDTHVKFDSRMRIREEELNEGVTRKEENSLGTLFFCSSELWYMFILWLSLIYFALTLMSTMLNKETRRYRAISILYDNLMLVLFLSAVTQRMRCSISHFPNFVALFNFQTPFSTKKSNTCFSVVYWRYYFNINVIMALGLVLYGNVKFFGNTAANGKRTLSRALWFVLSHWLTGLVMVVSFAWLGLLNYRQTQFVCSLTSTPLQTLDFLFMLVLIANLVSVFVLLKMISSRFLKLFASAKYKFISISV